MYTSDFNNDDTYVSRFVAEMDSHQGFWLVFDTKEKNRVVGVHRSATLAALDACKREQDCH
ncbi:MAG: hypothetical protein HN377_06520 [Alphaproteobacteria bacterium]|jgi:hypothetical protein|nr:hypothetical protein [Alphaproteobacteria bacterium]MBT7942716.1 hypothetical protein [Alphaproteobacteria bacterium]